jgi:DNA sulfur modification protein DndD
MRILQIKYKNIREFSDLTISLKNDNSIYPVSLIQMPNGLGKTTTMNLLRYSLNGMAESLDEKTVRDYKGNNGEQGEFEVKILIEHEIFYIVLAFDFNRGKITYYTSRATEGAAGGRIKGYHLPQEIKAILTNNFVRLFVFDGELASSIIDLSKNEAENAIKALYSIDKILAIQEWIAEIVDSAQKEAESNVITNQGIKQLNTRLKNAKSKLTELIKDKERYEKERNELLKKKQETIQALEKITESNDELASKLIKSEFKIQEINQLIVINTTMILNNSRDPINIHPILKKRIEQLGTEMTKLKLPRSTSSEFFEELTDKDNYECICGRTLEESHKEIIRNKMRDFLSDDQIGVINNIKTALRVTTEYEDIYKLVEEAKNLSKQYHQEKTNYGTLNSQLKQSDEEKLLKNLLDEKEKYIKRIEDLEICIKAITATSREDIKELDLVWEENIKLCKERIKELQDRYNDSLGIIHFSRKADILDKIIEEICQLSLKTLKEEIKKRTNVKITKILSREDILISEIGTSLKILNRSGVSEGQKLSIAYSFLSSMFEGSMNDLPFLVDSPAGSLDLEVRREVSQLIPPLFNQFIVFITSGEKDGFADTFYNQNNVQFLTLWKEHKSSKIVKSENTKEFFQKFQSEDDKKR